MYPALIDYETVKQFLQLTDASLKSSVETVIGWVSEAIQQQAGQPLKSMSVQLDWQSRGGVQYRLRHYPVTAVTALQSADTEIGSVFASVGTTFDVVKVGHLYYLRHNFVEGRMYRATITVGGATAPAEIVHLALEMVQVWLRESNLAKAGAGTAGVSSITETDSHAGLAKTTQMIAMQPRWAECIRRYQVVQEMFG